LCGNLLQLIKNDSLKRSSSIYYIVILLFVVAAYWQVALLRQPLMWDSRDAFFPWRYFMSECLRNGQFPVWDPYQRCGYPFLADPSSGAWYPIALLLGMLGRYSVSVFGIEFVLTLFVGGAGMFRLVSSLGKSPEAGLFAAFCFSASGFFVGHGEHFSWLVSAAWLPWLFWAYGRFLDTPRHGYMLLSAVFLLLMFTGGYPAFLFVSAYILLGLFVFSLLRAESKERRWLLLKGNLLFAGVSLVLIAGSLVSYTEAAQYITRGDGVTLAKANVLPFSPQSSLSFFLPFSVTNNLDFFGTDISMANAYFGLIGMVMLVAGIVVIKRRRYRVLIIASVIMLLISFGSYLPLRTLLYEYVPLMNLFRFPSLFSLFFILGFVIAAAGSFHVIFEKASEYRSTLRAIVILFIVFFLSVLLVKLFRHGVVGNYRLLLHDMNNFIRQSALSQRLIIQSVVQLFWLCLLLLIIQYRGGKFLSARSVLVLCALDMVMATQLNAYGTLIGPETCAQVNAKTRQAAPGFPVPDAHRALNAGIVPNMAPLNVNLGDFTKQPSWDGYNPFRLSNYDRLSEAAIRDSVWANPYIYLSYNAQPNIAGSILSNRNVALVSDAVYNNLKDLGFSSGGDDRVEVTTFKPGKVSAKTQTRGRSILILQQSGYPGWKVFVDDKLVQYFTTAYSNISIVLPAGQHEVVYKFEPAWLWPLAVLGFGSLISVIVCLVFFRRRLF
jgi:hypothetical protein